MSLLQSQWQSYSKIRAIILPVAEGILLVLLAVFLEALIDYFVDAFGLRPSRRRRRDDDTH